MSEQRIFLEDGIELTLVGRHFCDVFSVKDNASLVRRLKTS